ncbi:hypothetical protein [uncultured Tateyamaria sp.]|uniref:hypothetical protein n=1 Tax=uncultured Tateyamaria sp. TaxID=455651 RepID=UPI00261D9546|nr:hypothetical protein [uncultured Tateyamaria sp.]
MTLIVARVENGCLSIAADTMLTEHGMSLPIREGVLKSVCLNSGTCVSFSGSPELAMASIREFRTSFPLGANFATTISFFENSSNNTANDYIVAFASPAKIVTIRDGSRTHSSAKTHWIGDKNAYERFREIEHQQRRRHEHGQAISAVLFADENSGSPASSLYSAMRNVVLDSDVPSVGGFVTVLSNRGSGFRFSVYSDILLDWPLEFDEHRTLQPTDPIDLSATGQNAGYSVSQISSGYCNLNVVAFYLLKGQILFVFHEMDDNGKSSGCWENIEPNQIADTLDSALDLPFRAMCLVISAPDGIQPSRPRENSNDGVGLCFQCEVNTMSR